MSSSFKDVVPLVEHYHALSTQRALETSEVQEFAGKLEHIFSSIPSPARRIVPWGYTPDSADSKENTLGNSGINPFPPDALHKPKNEQEIIDIVKKAYEARSQVRVIGAAHSSPSNIILDAPQGVFPKNVVLISLTKYRGVSINKDKKLATVKAGTNIDKDPEEADSTKLNGLAFKLQRAGFALPDLGGITHQTIGGFLSTGIPFSDAFLSFAHSKPQDLLVAPSSTASMMPYMDLPSLMALELNMFSLVMTPIPPCSTPLGYLLDFVVSSQR